MPDKMSDRMPEDIPDKVPECLPDRMPEDLPDNMPEDMPDRMPEDMPEDMPEHMPGRMPEDMPDRMPEDMSDRMPEHLPEDMPGRMPESMPDRMPDRMPEDMPVTKCINVMVGITRSKVIYFSINPYCSFLEPEQHSSSALPRDWVCMQNICIYPTDTWLLFVSDKFFEKTSGGLNKISLSEWNITYGE